ncbi:pilus assembly protein PilM [Halarsenatibacter silvermanii]|uniref:Type IV pilus assembly protein PilM n=1 Tax=Halarsenatibacter silvermanii TaxID=321763 RepID=A0A1G9LD12_9FIRM|nr:pilus assembly protein PilM [Halarsenatibacter silvermanii]SDL59415.1 type IV pilus assembly protein PilM [Halarsenatibacter silvermanii]
MGLNPFKKIRGEKLTAIDFGHHSIKSVQGRSRGGEVKILGGVEKRLPEAAINQGRIEDVSQVAETLEELFRELPSSPGKIIFSPVCGREYIRRIDLPDMPEDELKDAVGWEIEKYLDQPPETTAYDYIKLSKNGSGQVLLLVVLDRSELKKYEQVFQKISYPPQTANIQDLALASLVAYQGECENDFMILNMGSQKTRIVIARSDNFFLSRTVELGGQDFTEVLKKTGLSGEEAEREKRTRELIMNVDEVEPEEIDIDLSFTEVDDKGRELIPLADELVAEVSRSLDFYSSRHAGESLEKIFYTGGGFALKGLGDYLNDNVKPPVQALPSFARFKGNPPSEAGSGSSMAAAAGLLVSEVMHNEG